MQVSEYLVIISTAEKPEKDHSSYCKLNCLMLLNIIQVIYESVIVVESPCFVL